MPVESASVTLGGKPCLDPFTALSEAQRLGIPVDSWIDKANSFTCPLGPAPGRGWLLMTRKSIDELDKETYHDLKFTTDETEAAIKSVAFVQAIAVFPTTGVDENAAYLVEVADKRQLAQMTAIDRQYNVLTPNPGGGHFTWSKNGGSDWTWATAFADLWALLGPIVGVVPSLPSSPPTAFVGAPNNFRFVGVSTWDAISALLEAIGCAIQFDPFTDPPCDVVSIGDSANSRLTEASDAQRSRLLWDSQTVVGKLGRLPGKCKVFFNATDYRIGTDTSVMTANDQWESDPTYSKEVTLDSAGDAASVQVLWGDMLALFDGNSATPTNQTDLDNRASEIANDYLRSLTTGGEFLHRVYSGALPDFIPEEQITAVRWRAQAGRGILSGMTTEVLRLPYLLTEAGQFPRIGQWPTARSSSAPVDLSRGRFPSFRVICFELTASLTSGSSAAAKIKKWDGGAWVDSGATTTVYDFVGAAATVASGKKGIAWLHNQSGKYVIVAYQC